MGMVCPFCCKVITEDILKARNLKYSPRLDRYAMRENQGMRKKSSKKQIVVVIDPNKVYPPPPKLFVESLDLEAQGLAREDYHLSLTHVMPQTQNF
jgi:hypothetical protein